MSSRISNAPATPAGVCHRLREWEVVWVAFALDCHDRECLVWLAEPRALVAGDIQQLMTRAIAQRFAGARPPARLEWLSDNGSPYTAWATVLQTERLGLTPLTTPAASPESNGMAEAFVRTLRRDYLEEADLRSADAVLAQLPRWIVDYNTVRPHSALGYLPPTRYREEKAKVRPPLSVSSNRGSLHGIPGPQCAAPARRFRPRPEAARIPNLAKDRVRRPTCRARARPVAGTP